MKNHTVATNLTLFIPGTGKAKNRWLLSLDAVPIEVGTAPMPFHLLRHQGMVGLLVSVFVASPLGPSIKCVFGERVRSGLYGQAGNKAFPACCRGERLGGEVFFWGGERTPGW